MSKSKQKAPNEVLDNSSRASVEYMDDSDMIFEFTTTAKKHPYYYLAVKFSPDDEGERKRNEFYKLNNKVKGLQYLRLVKWLSEEEVYFGHNYQEALRALVLSNAKETK